MKYNDGKWYEGTVTKFDTGTGGWKVDWFDDDDKTTSINFPNEDVHLRNVVLTSFAYLH